jgi:hypothetical protein
MRNGGSSSAGWPSSGGKRDRGLPGRHPEAEALL